MPENAPPRRFERVLLIQPPTGLYRRDDRCQCKVEDQTVQIIFPPIELASIAAVLRRGGSAVRIADYPATGGGWDDYVADLKNFRPDLVLVIVVTATHDQDFEALALAKETLGAGSVWTLAKGEYLDAQGEAVLSERPGVDFGMHGEVEEVLEQLCAGADLESLAGLIWRDGAGQVRRNPGRPVLENLDALPIPARDLLDNTLYKSPETGRPLTVVQGSRGCPSKCIFCPAGVMSGYKVRFRAPELIVEEISQCVRQLGIREFLFHGDNFTLNKKWLLELCDRIIASGLKIRWGCNSRVDTIDDERAERMRRAGCWVVAFGVESGDQEILDKMKKGQRVERALDAVTICKRNGLRTHAFFVIGTPWETRATLAKTLAFVRELDTDFFDFNIAYPLPGTEMHEIAMRDGLFEKAPDGAGYASAAVRSYELTSEELTRWRKQALLGLYLRPRYVIRMLARAGSPAVALNYVKAGVRRFRQLMK